MPCEVAAETIHFERTSDMDIVRGIARHPRIYEGISDDFSPKVGDFNPIDHPDIWYVLAWDDKELLGMWTLVPENHVCWEVHTCLLPSAWGPRASRAVKLAIRWAFENSKCLRLVTKVPAYNRIALRFAERAGMTEYGVNPKSFMKNGELHDQHLLGISKSEVVCL